MVGSPEAQFEVPVARLTVSTPPRHAKEEHARRGHHSSEVVTAKSAVEGASGEGTVGEVAAVGEASVMAKDGGLAHGVGTVAEARWFSMQYSVPLSSLGAVLEQLASPSSKRKLQGRQVEFKFIGGTNRTLLGANAHTTDTEYGRGLCVNVHWRLGPAEEGALQCLEELLQSLGGAPHLGKFHNAQHDRISEVMPRLPQFLKAVRQMDPACLFQPYATFEAPMSSS